MTSKYPLRGDGVDGTSTEGLCPIVGGMCRRVDGIGGQIACSRAGSGSSSSVICTPSSAVSTSYSPSRSPRRTSSSSLSSASTCTPSSKLPKCSCSWSDFEGSVVGWLEGGMTGRHDERDVDSSSWCAGAGGDGTQISAHTALTWDYCRASGGLYDGCSPRVIYLACGVGKDLQWSFATFLFSFFFFSFFFFFGKRFIFIKCPSPPHRHVGLE